VVTFKSDAHLYRKKPCKGCPWVKENAGSFPTQAFLHSANTANDMSQHRFSCHESGIKKPSTCAGFLLHGAQHNLAIRMDMIQGHIDPSAVKPDARELFTSYRAMAIANGVPENATEIAACR
jgi:hypothetical protein